MLEQSCLYPDCDDKDLKAKHLFATKKDKIIAYARLLAPGISYPDSSIGRVVVDQNFRKFGLGKELMNRAIYDLNRSYANHAIRISAQQYLFKFYSELGFLQESEPYLEDNIPHIEMAYYPK